MLPDTICKTVHQYNKEPIPPADFQKLQEIADDYSKVKNYVYQRYGGIKSLSKIYPGYTVQNEMTGSGLRTQLGLPSVYFYLAVFDALGDIKTQWTRTKTGVLEAVKANEKLTPEERHYLRFIIKVSGCFENILTGKEPVIPKNMQEKYESLTSGVDAERLNRYLCRQVRRKLRKLRTDKADGFAITERAYRYGSNNDRHGIFISTKENRKRIFVPLTDWNEYKKQLYVKLNREESSIEIAIPVETAIRHHSDYNNEIGLSAGMWQMFTTDSGHVYGGRFGELHRELTDFISVGDRTYRREKQNNPGRKKYRSRKAKLDAGLKDYVNREINRMLEEEKPTIIYIPKFPRTSQAGVNKKINYSVTLWKKGYVRNRLRQKCREHAVEIVEVLGGGISTECSACGGSGTYVKETFRCGSCGYEADKKVNAARNAIRRGLSGQRLNTEYIQESRDE